MKIELDGISLSETQSREGGVAEARSVSNVHASDNRNVVLHAVPGMEGNAIQDLGRTAVEVSFDGTVMGAGAKNIVEMLRSKFKQGEPVAFNSDISGAADVTKVVIGDFKVINVAGNVDRYDYSIKLKEFKEPPQQQSTPPSQDEEAEAWADGAAEETGQSINTTTGTVIGGEGKPAAGAEVTMTGEDGEYVVTADDEGNYKVENLPPADYEVKAGSVGAEKQAVSISGGEEKPAKEAVKVPVAPAQPAVKPPAGKNRGRGAGASKKT